MEERLAAGDPKVRNVQVRLGHAEIPGKVLRRDGVGIPVWREVVAPSAGKVALPDDIDDQSRQGEP
jgi:hypothetical protein